MDVVWFGVIAALVGITATAVGASWRVRSLVDDRDEKLIGIFLQEIKKEMTAHANAEHGKDGSGKTLRERIILLESAFRSLRRSIERRRGYERDIDDSQ